MRPRSRARDPASTDEQLRPMASRRNDSAASRLSEPDRRTYEALFRHPAPDDLAWGDVRALIEALSEVQDGRKGLFKATRRSVMATFRAPRAKQPLSADELAEVRSFIERSNEGVSTPVVAEGTRLLVVIDAGGARIYRIEMLAAVPRRIAPFDANGYPAHLRSSRTAKGRPPQPVSLGFYKDVARALRGAEEILLLACGEGGAEAMETLRSELESRHAAVARQIVGARVLTERRTKEEHFLAEARDFYAEPGRA